MKKIITVLLFSAIVQVGIIPATLPARAASTPRELGYIEEAWHGYVKGWFYDNDSPAEVRLAFRNQYGEMRYYEITNQQVSNKIAYFSHRSDIESYLRSKYGATSFKYPQSFIFTAAYLPVGTWEFQSATYQSMLSSDIPMGTGYDEPIVITESRVYSEGYVDMTSGPIKGWAYSSNSARPEIKILLSRNGGADQRTFVLPQNVDQQGQMIRTRRDDVELFLVNQRGQSNQFDADWNLGFTLNYRYEGLLPSGTWHIDSISAGGVDVPYGNTNPSADIYVP